ncbi:MAG: Fic family protein [Solobacterium sp.]|nr:Fic family protein [Solobacterium sp.]
MTYRSVKETAEKWNITERVVRQYCRDGRVAGAYLKGKTWYIPADAEKPERKSRVKKTSDDLSGCLVLEKKAGIPGGIYHKIQIEFTFHSNHMEGSRLTHEQTRYIFETNTIDAENEAVNVDDIVETVNHFRCIDLIIDQARKPLTEKLIRQLHLILKSGTADSRKSWFAVGEYKKLPNEVGGKETVSPENVPAMMKQLLEDYRQLTSVSFDDLLDFHVRFETIHPFQDGNGRIGRLILFKECLRCGIVPFIIEDDMKMFYYRGLQKWEKEPGYLRDTCLAAQDRFKKYLDYFGITYKDE